MEIEEIKNIWKEQKARDNEVKTSGYYSSLLEQLEKNEKKTKRNYIYMSIILLLTIAFIDRTAVESMHDKTFLTWTGFGLIYLAMAAMITVSWATVIKFKINSITESSMDFLKRAKEKLTLRNKIRTIGVPVYISLLTIGITFTYIQITGPMKTGYRILTFAVFYAFIISVSAAAYKKEKKKYIKNVKPIEDRINELLSAE